MHMAPYPSASANPQTDSHRCRTPPSSPPWEESSSKCHGMFSQATCEPPAIEDYTITPIPRIPQPCPTLVSPVVKALLANFFPTPHNSFLSPPKLRYSLRGMTTLPLSELLGATVYDPAGAARGRVREVTLAPQEDRDRIASFIVKTKTGNRVLPFSSVSAIDASVHALTNPPEWPLANGAEGLFLLERDL